MDQQINSFNAYASLNNYFALTQCNRPTEEQAKAAVLMLCRLYGGESEADIFKQADIELIQSFLDTKAKIMERLNGKDRGGPWLDSISELRRTYRETYQRLLQAKGEVNRTKNQVSKKIINDMISDVNFAIEWMDTARRPGNKRGIERRSAYQRSILVDPMRLQAISDRANEISSPQLSEAQRDQVEAAMELLSERERACYTMAYGEGFSRSYIAEMLGVTKDSVKVYLARAQKKFSIELQNGLFF
ncbi:sigma-70 family RNA polymerase sigma factor [Paenibacillus sp. HWE-109]|uniref:sigma-70 family RNA polymerase sigma factor n=1 Tax=Paenibacillus sp. HWE-109 TaxID=1306526 RepID=UPI001EDD328E|nr:sigma-70 family RNA polymerase sigma factor [Paenibacillus sp. HWE-109]UKS24322.1 sigma-70 family RNA polymerase sigma factor [Paenibacillus sp. HWE-109]